MAEGLTAEGDVIVHVARMGPATGPGIGAAEKAILVGRVDALEVRRIDQMAGVNASGKAAGKTLVVAPDGTGYVFALPVGLGEVAEGGATVASSVTSLDFHTGFAVTDAGGGEVSVVPDFGSASGQVAEGNHTHTLPTPLSRIPISAKPAQWSGTVTLGTGSFSLDVGVPTLVEVELFIEAEGTGGGRGEGHLILAIDGNSDSTSALGMGEPLVFEQGINAQRRWDHNRTLTRATAGDPATRTVTASLQWVNPFGTSYGIKVWGGWMRIKLTKSR